MMQTVKKDQGHFKDEVHRSEPADNKHAILYKARPALDIKKSVS
jgi:hypothetical protein